MQFIYQTLGNKLAIGLIGKDREEIESYFNWFYNFKACSGSLMMESETFGYFETNKYQFYRGLFNAIQMRLCKKSNDKVDLEGKMGRRLVFNKVREELINKFTSETFTTTNKNDYPVYSVPQLNETQYLSNDSNNLIKYPYRDFNHREIEYKKELINI